VCALFCVCVCVPCVSVLGFAWFLCVPLPRLPTWACRVFLLVGAWGFLVRVLCVGVQEKTCQPTLTRMVAPWEVVLVCGGGPLSRIPRPPAALGLDFFCEASPRLPDRCLCRVPPLPPAPPPRPLLPCQVLDSTSRRTPDPAIQPGPPRSTATYVAVLWEAAWGCSGPASFAACRARSALPLVCPSGHESSVLCLLTRLRARWGQSRVTVVRRSVETPRAPPRPCRLRCPLVHHVVGHVPCCWRCGFEWWVLP
jgi:hypothetical protein